MFYRFVISRFYSLFLGKLLVLFSMKSKTLTNIDKCLDYPPDIDRYKSEFLENFGIDLNDLSLFTKEAIQRKKERELLSIHKYLNTVLNVRLSAIVYHELLRRRSRFRTVFQPYGIRRLLAAHCLLGGLGIKTIINKYPRFLIITLVRLCSIQKNESFCSYLRGKTVAVCGGAPSPRDNTPEILGKEVVVRLNKVYDFNERSDVIYFRSERLGHLKETGELEVLPGLDAWVSLKTYQHFRDLKNKFNSKNLLFTPSTDAAFDMGKLNAIPNVCLDLIYNGSEEIMIFDSDLNLSRSHKKGYRNNNQPEVQFDLIFGEHPSYVQFCLLKFFFNSGLLSFEDNPNFRVEWCYRKFLKKFAEVYSDY